MATFRSSNGTGSWGGSSGVSFPGWPAGATTGDYVIWAVNLTDDAHSVTPQFSSGSGVPSGWTELANIAYDVSRLLVWGIPYVSGMSNPSTQFLTRLCADEAFIVAYSGYSSVSVLGTNSGASGNGSVSGASSARGNGLVLTVFGNQAAVTSTPPSGATERGDTVSGSTGGGMSFNEAPTAAAVGTQSNTFSASTAPWAAASIGLDIGGVNVGPSLSGVTFPLRHAGIGPFKSSAGSYYFLGRNSTNTARAIMFITSDPVSGTWAASTSIAPNAEANAIEAMAAYQVGDVLHVAYQITNGKVTYTQFDMSTDTWLYSNTSAEQAVASAAFSPTTNYPFVDLVVRSNGNVVIVYAAGQTAMTSGFNMVRYVERTGANTYSAAVNVDNGGSINWSGGVAALGASDRVHFFLADFTGAVFYQRTLTAANVLQTWGSSFASINGQPIGLGNAFSYLDSSTTRVRASAYAASAAPDREALFKLDSSDAPTATAEPASNVVPSAANNQPIMHLVYAGTTLHFLYADSTQDLFHDSSTGGGGAWGTDVEEWDNATISRIAANFYFRGTDPKIGMMVDDGGTLKYAEIALPLPTAPTGLTATLIAE